MESCAIDETIASMQEIDDRRRNRIDGVRDHHKTRYLTISQFCKCYEWPPEGGLRHLIFNEKTNGFNKVVRRIGRRVLINEQAWLSWLEEKGSEGQLTATNRNTIA
jgi:hypothetical protein